MRILETMTASASGLTAQRLRMDIIANNLANLETTRTSGGGPYRRQVPVFAEILKETAGGFKANGVRVTTVVSDPSPPRMVYNPEHPDANPEGYVALPNIEVVAEMADLLAASRAYEANVTVLNATKAMSVKALEIGRG